MPAGLRRRRLTGPTREPRFDPYRWGEVLAHYDARRVAAQHNGVVSTVPDLSGNGRDLTAQGSPVLDVHGMGHLPGIYYSGTGVRHYRQPSFVGGRAELTVWLAMRTTSGGYYFSAADADTGNGMDLNLQSASVLRSYLKNTDGFSSAAVAVPESSINTINDGRPWVMEASWSQRVLLHRVSIGGLHADATVTAQAARAGVTDIDYEVAIGGFATSGSTMWWGECIIYGSYLDSAAREAIRRGLARRWLRGHPR